MNEVRSGTLPLVRLKGPLGSRRYERLCKRLDRLLPDLQGRSIWHVNSTATGGGVAELLGPLTAYKRGLGLDVGWVVISGTPSFFEVTKRIHNGIHGVDGFLHPNDRRIYARSMRSNAADLVSRVRPGDFVICHDPQTAGLIPRLREAGAIAIWRSHIGHEDRTRFSVAKTWEFLSPYVGSAHAVVFSRPEYVPEALEALTHKVIHPSIDPLSVKNMPLGLGLARSILKTAGILEGRSAGDTVDLTLPDGRLLSVARSASVLREGGPLSTGIPLVVQVSRWDRLKDPVGVMMGFARNLRVAGAHLVLAGPDVEAVPDDPEGAEVFGEVRDAWRSLSRPMRKRVHVICLPMADVEENAAMVNALQRHARVIVQKSIYEGFGLTVTEAMWKGRPVVATKVGGIQDQIRHGRHGLLIPEPHDRRMFGAAVRSLLEDPYLARRLGRNARNRVASKFLVSRHMLEWLELLGALSRGACSGQRR